MTNELEELLYRWQQIEMCCRLDLGVSSDFVSDASEVPPSPLGQACSNIGSLGSTNSHSRETLRRVFTYPSFQSVNCNTSYYQSVSKYKLARDVTPTSCYSEVFPEVRNAVDKHESEANGHQNASTSEHIKTTDSFDDEQNIICDNVDAKLEVSINDKAMSEIPTGQTLDRNTSKNDLKREGCGENGTIEEVKSEKLSHSSDTKFFLHKKKWWSRNKKYHSLDIDAEFETDSKDDHGGSLPNLPQGKASKKHSYNRKHEHLSSKGSKP